MPVRVLVVDDSGFFRRRLCEILSADALIEVVGTAVDGADGVKKAAQLNPDVITMDIEMPVMDGITAVRRIMAAQPTPVLMFSSLTHEGAQATLNALEAGAADFLPKQFEDIAKDRDEAKQLLCSRVRALARKQVAAPRPAVAATAQTASVACVRCAAGGGEAGSGAAAAGRRQGRSGTARIQSDRGHRHLHRWSGGLAAGADQIAGEFPGADPAGAAHAGEFHAGLRRAPQSDVRAHRQTGRGRRYLDAGDGAAGTGWTPDDGRATRWSGAGAHHRRRSEPCTIARVSTSPSPRWPKPTPARCWRWC